MPQGKVIGNGILDFSGMHLAVLSVEGIIASVGELNTVFESTFQYGLGFEPLLENPRCCQLVIGTLVAGQIILHSFLVP